MKNTADNSVISPIAEPALHGYYSSSTSILVCFVCWVIFYFAVRYLYPNKCPEWTSRVVTLFHGVGAAINGLSECFVEGELFEHAADPQSENQQVILVVSLGYFMLDLLWCVYYQTESNLMIGHHIFSVYALYRMLMKNIAGAQTVCALGGMEVTNPMLQIRWFLRSEGFRDSKVFTYIEVMFVVFFVMMRIGFGTYFFVNIIFFQKNDLEYMCMAIALYIISVLFVINTLVFIIGKYFQDSPKRTSINAPQS